MKQKVYARKKLNRTGWPVVSGEQYRLVASGHWFDFYIRTGPAGYPSPNCLFSCLEKKRRKPDADWFALVAYVDTGDSDDHQDSFVVGTGLSPWEPSKSGELVCYANDLPYMYWNNFGSIGLELIEEQGQVNLSSGNAKGSELGKALAHGKAKGFGSHSSFAGPHSSSIQS
jgi:hypothetical protein